MKRETTTNNWTTEVREVAGQFGVGDIEQCMTLALANKPNNCLNDKTTEEIMSVLAKAGYIRTQMDKGLTLAQSMRELGRRIRSMQQTVTHNE